TTRSRKQQGPRAEGYAGERLSIAARGVPPVGSARPARLSRLVLPVAAVRRRSARQHDQRPAPAGADPLRALEAGRAVVQPGSAADPPRARPRMDAGRAGARALSLRDREPVPSAG